jgi:CheY-like chemotaxis protein
VSDQNISAQILHVDDDEDVLELVADYLQGEEIEGWGRPVVTSCRSFDHALAELETRRFDLIVLDVRLGGHDKQDLAPDEEEGVRTLEQIKGRRFLPVVFWTGLPSAVRHVEGPLVHVREKTESLEVLAGSVAHLFGTGLPTLNRALRRLVEDEQRRYMWDFVAEHWDELSGDGDAVGLAHLLVRRLGRTLSGPGIGRVAAELGAGGPSSPADGTIQAAEMYIIPPLPGTSPGVGEIYRDDSQEETQWWLTMTPACDLEHDKAEYVVLARAGSVDSDSRIAAWRERDNAKNKLKVRELVSHKTGGQDDRWLFLPAAPTLPNLVVDLQQICNVERENLDTMVRVGSLVSPFAEAMVSRFTRYFGRVGTDDLDVVALMRGLEVSKRSDGTADRGT